MPDPSINLLPVIVAGLINMGIGALWYSPYVAGKIWIRYMQKEGKDINEQSMFRAMIYVINTILALVFAYVLAHIIKFANLNTFSQGANAGFWIWLGFVVTTVLPGYLYESRPKILYLLFISYQLIAIVLMGGIIAIW